MGNQQQGLAEQQGGGGPGPQLAYDVNARAAAAVGGIRLDGRRGMKMVEGKTRGQFVLQQKDEDKMPCMISVDSADIDGKVLTHKVRIHLFSKHTHYWFSYTLSTSTPQHTLYLHFHAFTLTHHLGCGIAKRPTYRKNIRWGPSNFWAKSCEKRSYIGQISLYESD